MDPKAKNVTVLLIAVLIISLVLAGTGFFLLQKEQVKSRDLEAKVEELTTKQKIAQERLQRAQSAIDLMKSELKQKDDNIAALKEEVLREQSAKENALAGMEQTKGELDKAKAVRLELEKKLSGVQGEAEQAKSQIKELQARKQELEAKLKELEVKAQGVDLGTIAVSQPEAAAPSAAPAPAAAAGVQPAANIPGPSASLEAKILVVNKDYNFAVINMGSKDGIAVGQLFSFYHNNQYVGDGKVEKVHDSMAALGFLSPGINAKVVEGDKVLVKK
jgi:hypothetical protein